MKSEASRHSSRIVAKYKNEAAALKGRLLEEEALSSKAGLPPPGMLRVAASHNPTFSRDFDRPISVPTVSLQQQMSNWQYTLAKPVTAQQPRTNQSWRNSLDIRSSNKGSSQGDPGSLRSSSAMPESAQSRSGYWKGQKLTGGSKGVRGPRNSRVSNRQQKSQQMSPMSDVMAHMGNDWNIPDTADGGKQHSSLYAHVESRLLAGGFIPRAPGSVMAVNLDHPFMDMEDAEGEAMQILRDTMHPVHDGKVTTATVEEALANKLSALHKLSYHSDELERQMEEYKGAPGKMQQWLSDANSRRHMEDPGMRNAHGHQARRSQPQYPLGPSRGRRMSPERNRDVTTQQEPVEPVDPRRLGNKRMDDFFRGLQTLDSQRAASSTPRLELGGAPQSPGTGMDLEAGVINRQELHGRLVEYFHGNAALADDCLKAVWDLARPPVSNQAAGFMFGADWQEVIPEEGNPFPSRPGTMQERNARAFTPSIGRPDSRSITSAPQPSNGNFRQRSSAALRPTTTSSATGSSIVPATPGTALGHHHPAARVEALGKKHWHNVLFPSSQPATNRSLDMLEQWVVAMAEHLGIDMGDVLFAEQERVNQTPPATQQGEYPGEPPGTQAHAAGALAPELVEPSGFFEKAFLLYSVAYLELVRQVTIQSAQRGELLLRLWHSICRLLSSLLKSMDKQLHQDKEKFDNSYQKGFDDGKLEGDGAVAHWKAKVNSTTNFLEQKRAKWKEEAAALHKDMSNKDQMIKQIQAELDSSREKLAELQEASGKSPR